MLVRWQYAAISMAAMFIVSAASVGRYSVIRSFWEFDEFDAGAAHATGDVSAGERISLVTHADGGSLAALRVADPCRNGPCSMVRFKLDGVPGPVVAGGGRRTFTMTVSHATGMAVGAEW